MQSSRTTCQRSLLNISLVVIAPFSCGYFLSTMYRAVNAIVAPNLVREIGLTAGELGFLTAAYLIAFAGFQLPLGIVLDRFGPRRVQAALLTMAALGSFGFASSEQMGTLVLSRALIGLGFAGGLMAGFKAVVLWFPPSRHALANGCIMSCGGLGLLAASAPAEWLVQLLGWRDMFIVTAVLTLLVAGLILVVVPERQSRSTTAGLRSQLRKLVEIITDRFFWRIAPLLSLTSGTQIGIHTLWAGPWFRDVAGYDRDGVATGLMVMAAAFLIGTLMVSAVADWLGRRGVDLLHVMLGWLGVYFLAQITLIVGWSDYALLAWFVFGMVGQAAILGYPKLAEHFGMVQSGRAHTSINLLVFLSAFAVQFIFGMVLDLFPISPDGGYDPDGYRAAIGLFFSLQILALIHYWRFRV